MVTSNALHRVNRLASLSRAIEPFIELEEAIAPVIVFITMRAKTPTCGECDGVGDVRCNVCGGRGSTSNSRGAQPCDNCRARGRRTCHRCGGAGCFARQ